jgi:aspartate aminotransferase
MVRLPVDDAEKFCMWCLTDFSYEGQTVMMAPGAGFYSHPDDGRNEVRMAYVLNRDDLAKALVVLQKALEAYQSLQ